MKHRARVAVAVAFAASLVAACGRHPAPPAGAAAASATPVRLASVEDSTVSTELRAVGTLSPRDEIRLSFKIGGVIDGIAVEPGDAVRAGQMLAVLKRAEVDAALAQASEAADKARRDLERGKRLRADEVATEEQVENLTTAYRVAQASLEAARFNARFARIDAPVDGVVLQKLAEQNELVAGGEPVLVLGATGRGWVVRTALADRDAVRVQPGDLARIDFDAFPGREFPGAVTRIASSADQLTGTFEVEIEVAPAGARFARGLVAKVALVLGDGDERRTQAIVPVAALVEAEGPAATVYVVGPDTPVARRRQVAVGPVIGDRVVVTDGLVAGEQVVTDGAAWLVDGAPVRVVGGPG